jgi:hypothetical protein
LVNSIKFLKNNKKEISMKLTKLSLAAIVVAGFVTSSFAGNSLADAFKKGTVSGAVDIYAESYSVSDSTQKDHGFTVGSVGLNYETGSFKGFKASLGFRANHNFSEVEDGDYGDGSEPTAVLNTANVSYENDYFSLILGRQEVDLEWMGDFHEAYTGVITAIPNTTITYVHSVRYDGDAGNDDSALGNFDKTNGNNGVDAVDVKYDGPINGMQLNGYYYHAQDVADWYGAKVNFDNDMFGFTAQYAQSSSDDLTANLDGSILATEARGNIKGASLSIGYIATDKDGGIGGMDMVGDNINPLEDGNHVYDADADTVYGSASYEISDIGLSVMYGSTDYGNNNEAELNIGVEYDGVKNLEFEAVYVNINSDDITTDGNAIKAKLTYSF